MLGRQFRKKKHPKRPNVLHGGLGAMLAGGAVGFMAADLMMGGDLTSGLIMGGADLAVGGAAMAVAGGGMMLDAGLAGGGMMADVGMAGGGMMMDAGEDAL